MNTKQTERQMIAEWLMQPAPAPETLTQDDVMAARLALDVISHYHNEPDFEIDSTEAGMYASAMEVKWSDMLAIIKRGVAVLNGYLLIYNGRVPVYQLTEDHPDAVVSVDQGAGYLAGTEMHRSLSLIPSGELITLTAATQIMYDEVTQSKRVMLREDVGQRLQPFVDQTEPNPQKRLRVAKRQVLQLKMRRSN